jgi:alpha-L-rhamnosidase
MRSWIGRALQIAPTFIWKPPPHPVLYRDWVELGASTPRDLVCSAFLARSIELTARSAEAIDDATVADLHWNLHSRAQEAFAREFVLPDGRLTGETQAGYALALAFDLVPTPLRAEAFRHLEDKVAQDGRFTTGIHGTPRLLEVLAEGGRSDLALDLLVSTRFPSYRHWIELGLTTIPEHWNAFDEAGNPLVDRGNSLNHFALGSPVDWLFNTIAGLRRNRVGWKQLRLDPQTCGRLTYASASMEVPAGVVSVSWALEADVMTLDVKLPAGTSALIGSGDSENELGPGSHHMRGVASGSVVTWTR